MQVTTYRLRATDSGLYSAQGVVLADVHRGQRIVGPLTFSHVAQAWDGTTPHLQVFVGTADPNAARGVVVGRMLQPQSPSDLGDHEHVVARGDSSTAAGVDDLTAPLLVVDPGSFGSSPEDVIVNGDGMQLRARIDDGSDGWPIATSYPGSTIGEVWVGIAIADAPTLV